MMTLEKTMNRQKRRKQLGSLLDAAERGGKKDAVDYTSGYLNEANLYMPHEIYGHKGWEESKQVPLTSKKSNIPVSTKQKHDDQKMFNALTDFSLGNDGLLPSVKGKQRPKKGWKNSIDEQALIEELDTDRIMLTRSQPTRIQRSWALEDEREQASSTQPTHKFANFNTGATKRDQLRDFREFEHSTLRKQDVLAKGVLSGNQAVIGIEQQLNKALQKLGDAPGTTFHRLQAHSDSLDELSNSSTTFSYVLKQIKIEYDEYMSWLLDNSPSSSHILKEQVGELYKSNVSNPKQLAQAQKETQKLESQGKKLLEENDRLREEVRRERDESLRYHPQEDRPAQPRTELYNKRQVANTTRSLDLADQLQDLHATILEKLDRLDDMRAEVRKDYVPSNVCHNLEQCLKDTEIEIQKLLKQNEILQSSIDHMESSVTAAIDDNDVSSRDKQKCLGKLSRIRIPGIKRPFTNYSEYAECQEEIETGNNVTNLYNPILEGTSSEEEDETQADKWDWYIS